MLDDVELELELELPFLLLSLLSWTTWNWNWNWNCSTRPGHTLKLFVESESARMDEEVQRALTLQ